MIANLKYVKEHTESARWNLLAPDDNIREICQRVLTARDEEQFRAALTELRLAVREQITELENRGTLSLKKPNNPKP